MAQAGRWNSLSRGNGGAGMAGSGEKAGDGAKIFVSYSRDDVAFADQLVAALDHLRYRPIIDRHEAHGGDDWKKRLGALILTADTVVFVMSPHSAVSEICRWELEEAERLGKRLIPIVCEPFDRAKLPVRLENINYIYFYAEPKVPGSGFGTGLRQLDHALKTDIDWIRDQARLAEMAERWNARGRPDDLLLRGSELAHFLAWRANKPAGEAVIPTIQRAFLDASEDAQLRRDNDERARISERERAIARARSATFYGAAAALVLGLASLFGGWLALKGNVDVAYGRSDLYAQQAKELNRRDIAHYDTAMLIALAGDPATQKNFLQREVFQKQNARTRAQMLRSYVNSSLERTLIGHVGWARSAAFSPEGARIVTASSDRTVKLWDATSGEEIRTFIGHKDVVTSAGFSPDGLHILTASWDGTAKLWDAATGDEIRMFADYGSGFMSATFSPDGNRILTSSRDGAARLWDTKTGNVIMAFLGAMSRSGAFSPDGTRIVTASYDGTASLWDLAKRERIGYLVRNGLPLSSAAFSPDGTRIVTASYDGTATIWDAATFNEIRTIANHRGLLISAAFSPDGSHIVTASWDGTAKIWNAETGDKIRTLAGHTGAVSSAIYSPDGARIATASLDRSTKIWNALAGVAAQTFTVSSEGATWSYGAYFTTRGKARIFTASDDREILFWDLESITPILTLAGLHLGELQSIGFSPDETLIVTGSADGTAKIWNAETGETIRTLAGHAGAVSSTAFSPDGGRIVTASSDGTAKLWNTETGDEIRTFAGHEGYVHSAAFSPDGAHIVTASWDETARLWDANTGEEIMQFSGHEHQVFSASFSPTGKQIVTASDDGTAKLWETETGNNILTFIGHESGVLFASFSPQHGTRILTTSRDGTAKLWDAMIGEELQSFGGQNHEVRMASFSPDETQILSFSRPRPNLETIVKVGEAKIWTLDPILLETDVSRQVAMACAKARATGVDRFTRADRERYALIADLPEGWSPCD